MPITEIDQIKDCFIKALSPLRIYLFGSFAEGRQSAESDFDFYIVVNDSEKDLLGLTAKAYKSIRHKRQHPVDIIINTKNRFDRKRMSPVSVEGEVAKKGLLLYEA